MQQTLVLDQSYQPINTVTWMKAMLYIAKDKVDVLEQYETDVHFNVGMPAVVRLRHTIVKHKHRIKFSRQNVLARDNFKCQYCGTGGLATTLTFDHVIPKARGGKTCWENIVMACTTCNTKKAAKLVHECGMHLKKRPVRPTWLPVFHILMRDAQQVPEEWRDYWTVELD